MKEERRGCERQLYSNIFIPPPPYHFSQPISDLYEKEQILNRIIEKIIRPEMMKMSGEEIRGELNKVGVLDSVIDETIKNRSGATIKDTLIDLFVKS